MSRLVPKTDPLPNTPHIHILRCTDLPYGSQRGILAYEFDIPFPFSLPGLSTAVAAFLGISDHSIAYLTVDSPHGDHVTTHDQLQPDGTYYLFLTGATIVDVDEYCTEFVNPLST